jgi:selenocysteine-specific elongation factor
VHVIATAGHVDHGKSTLVLALTGTDPDRLVEEKARGLTIDLGFAATTLPSGAEVGFVDVPGHVRFIKNMLAGVGAVDACLFVVAATEGWKPQSEEHLRILSLLGVEHGLIALTKVGLVDAEWRGLAELEVVDRVVGTFLEGAEIVPIDVPSGQGLDGSSGLRQALDRLLATTPKAIDHGRPRLWVDRSFAARGSGTVVTGTLSGGRLAIDDEIAVEPRQPSGWRGPGETGGLPHRAWASADRGAGLRGRIRGLQSHGRALASAAPGRRLAVNLAGIGHGQIHRGQALVRPGQWHRTAMVDATLTVLSGLDHEVGRRGAYAAYLGSGEHPVKVRILGRASLAPGDTGAVRLWLDVELPLVPGDRYVLREAGRSQTVGGGEILDVSPVLPATKAAPTRSVERVIAERGWVEVAALHRLTGTPVAPTVGDRWVVSPAALAAVAADVRALVKEAGPLGLDIASLDERQRAVLSMLDEIEVEAGRARVEAASEGAPDPIGAHPWVAALEASPFDPPVPDGVSRVELRELERRGRIVNCDGVWFAAGAVTTAAGVVARLLEREPTGITVASVRDALGTSRKHTLPLLTHFDASGITRRRGDVRIGGPRLPLADPDRS